VGRGKAERTSRPKGHKNDNVYARDKSPAYHEAEFSPACEAMPFVAVPDPPAIHSTLWKDLLTFDSHGPKSS